MSDLLLVERSAAGAQPFRRGGVQVAPLGRTDRLDDDAPGVAFELYDLSEDEPYRIEVELVPDAGGEPIRVAFRPYDEARRQQTWDRTPARPGASPGTAAASRGDGWALEILILDLAPVPAGLYTLRTRVQFAGGEQVVRERPQLRRRLADSSTLVTPGGGLERIEQR
jgi:hypothetical protein